MRPIKKSILLLALCLAVCSICFTTSTYAAIPKIINYQGVLRDSAGKPLNGAYNVTFRLYDSAGGGSPIWSETHTGVTVERGVFNTTIGGVTPLDLSFDRQYYLGIQLGSDAEMSPRQPLASSAYALRANVADEAVQAQNANKVANVEVSITPAANKLLPLDSNAKIPSSIVNLKIYDSGWFNVSASDSVHYKDLTHNLGTTSLLFELLYATGSNGSGTIYRCETDIYWANGQYNDGGSVRNITTTTARVTWGGNYVYQGINDSGQTDQLRDGSYKLIILALN